MGMFDYYQPAGPRHCPVCGRPLVEWQGKDGPNAIFVWAEGSPAPIDHDVDDDLRSPFHERQKFRLPRTFEIYSYDCPEHQPIGADCECDDSGVWTRTVLRDVKQRR